jgi:hypothetical protein
LTNPECLNSALHGHISNNRKRFEEEHMPTDRDKGIVGSASDRIRETSGALRARAPWASPGGVLTCWEALR